MAKELNAAIVAELAERYEGVANLVLVHYQGLTAPQMSEVRQRLRANDINLEVVKNRLARLAFEKAGLPDLRDLLIGPTAVASSDTDFIAVAREVVDFAKGHKQIAVRGGVAEGSRVDPETVAELAGHGSRKMLVSMAVGAVAAPLSSFMGVSSGMLRSLVSVLDAHRSKLQGD